MKKILYIATIDDHIKAFHLPYLKMLKENGYEVHVATNGGEQFQYCDVKHRISIDRKPLKLKNLKAIKQLKKIINEQNYNVIHCHTPMGSVVGRLASIEARKKGMKVIYTCHGFHFYKGAPLKNWVIYYPVEKFLSRYTDNLITINKEDFQLAKKKFNKCKNINYIPGIGIDCKKFDNTLLENQKQELKKSLGLNENDFIIIFPARLDKNKNQIMLISAMEKLTKTYSNVHLILPGNDELNGYYQQIAKEKNLDDKIHFLGFREDVDNLLKIADLAVSTSIREGFGINLVEALYSNVPVIATNNRGHRDIIENGKNGYLIGYNIEELCDKISNIIEGKVSFCNLRESANKFLLDVPLEEMKKIYNNM